MTTTRRRWSALTVVGVAGVLVLAGCTSEPAPLPTTATTWAAEPDGSPAVYWPNGEPDDGKWADDPWVQATRTYGRASAGAYYLNDFTLARFQGTRDAFEVDRMAGGRSMEVLSGWATSPGEETRGAPDTPDPLEYPPGPLPFYVLDVDTYESSSGQERATVYVCGIEVWWVTDPQDVPRDAAEQEPKLWEYRLGRVSDTQIQSSAASPALFYDGKRAGEVCDTSRVRLGFFDPAPAYGVPVLPWEVLDSSGEPVGEFDPEIAAHATPAPTGGAG